MTLRIPNYLPVVCQSQVAHKTVHYSAAHIEYVSLPFDGTTCLTPASFLLLSAFTPLCLRARGDDKLPSNLKGGFTEFDELSTAAVSRPLFGLYADHASITDPGYMRREIPNFWKDNFDTWNKRKVSLV